MEDFTSGAQAKRNVLSAVEAVAGMLGNTSSVCRKSYIHPAIIDSYMDRSLAQSLAACAGERYCAVPAGSVDGDRGSGTAPAPVAPSAASQVGVSAAMAWASSSE